MPNRETEMRKRAQRFYALTDDLQRRLQALEESDAPAAVRVVPAPAEGDDIAVAYTVLVEASPPAQEDVRAVIDKVKEINQAKQAFRKRKAPALPDELDLEATFHLTATFYAMQLMNELEELLAGLEGKSDLGEMESLRLQMAMDRLSKTMSTLSNLLKKISDTASQITQNIK